MKNVLVVSKSDKATQGLIAMLKQEGCTAFTTATTAEEAKRCVSNNQFDLIFIYTPLADEVGLNLSAYLANSTSAGVFIFVSNETALKAGAKLMDCGVTAIIKPVNADVLHQCLLAWGAFAKRLETLTQENKSLKNKLEEIKLIDRAKCVLMQCLAMSESQAHRYLEKQAMALQISNRRVAEQVLNTYDF